MRIFIIIWYSLWRWCFVAISMHYRLLVYRAKARIRTITIDLCSWWRWISRIIEEIAHKLQSFAEYSTYHLSARCIYKKQLHRDEVRTAIHGVPRIMRIIGYISLRKRIITAPDKVRIENNHRKCRGFVKNYRAQRRVCIRRNEASRRIKNHLAVRKL